jgi:hypothetical protein
MTAAMLTSANGCHLVTIFSPNSILPYSTDERKPCQLATRKSKIRWRVPSFLIECALLLQIVKLFVIIHCIGKSQLYICSKQMRIKLPGPTDVSIVSL